jgi:hypothetical protein
VPVLEYWEKYADVEGLAGTLGVRCRVGDGDLRGPSGKLPPSSLPGSLCAWNRVTEEAAGMCRRAQTGSRNPLVIHRTLRTSRRMQHEILATRAVLGSARRHAFDGSISSGLLRLEHGRARLEWGSSACCLHAVTNSTLISSPGAAFAPRTLPPIRSTRPRTSDSPMPVPWVLRVSSRSARKNGWKMASRCSC